MILPAQPWRDARSAWELVDDLGLDHAWTYDHVVWRGLAGRRWYAAMPTLAAAAQVTSRIRLGTLVCTPNFRHPVPLAKEAATLADLSDGRFILGLGAGAGGPDATVLGGPALSPAQRAGRFAEFVELVAALLRQPVTDAAGEHFAASGAWIGTPEEPRAGVRLAVAATGPRGLRLAARHAHVWVTNGRSPRPGVIAPRVSTDDVRRQLDGLRAACAAEGRDPAELDVLLVHTDTEDAPLASVGAFADAAARWGEIGVTDLVVPFPRKEPPYAGDVAVLERVARDVLPSLRAAGGTEAADVRHRRLG